MAAKNEIEINGRTYNKCHISKKQWEECMTPCVFCHSNVQKECNLVSPYCDHEKVCYIDLGAVYGEEMNEN